MSCLLCHRQEKYNSNPGAEYVCSQCVQLLLMMNQEELKRGYALAVEKGYSNKAYALESFIMEESGEQINKRRNTGKRNTRKRTFGIIRDQQKSNVRFKAKQAVAVSENQ